MLPCGGYIKEEVKVEQGENMMCYQWIGVCNTRWTEKRIYEKKPPKKLKMGKE